jgi:hypothetical protein
MKKDRVVSKFEVNSNDRFHNVFFLPFSSRRFSFVIVNSQYARTCRQHSSYNNAKLTLLLVCFNALRLKLEENK